MRKIQSDILTVRGKLRDCEYIDAYIILGDVLKYIQEKLDSKK